MRLPLATGWYRKFFLSPISHGHTVKAMNVLTRRQHGSQRFFRKSGIIIHNLLLSYGLHSTEIELRQ